MRGGPYILKNILCTSSGEYAFLEKLINMDYGTMKINDH